LIKTKKPPLTEASVGGGSVFILDIDHDVLHPTVQKGAEVVEGHGADGLVVLESVKQTAADAEVVDELVGRNTLFLHGFVERLVGNHFFTPIPLYVMLNLLTIVDK
jgi:hypothetical protein